MEETVATTTDEGASQSGGGPPVTAMPTRWSSSWRENQWAAFLKSADIPVMERTKESLVELASRRGAHLSPREIAETLVSDPFLSLRILVLAEHKKHSGKSGSIRNLSRDTTTVLASVMQSGTDDIIRTALSAPSCPHSPGLDFCEKRASLAARIAMKWGAWRADVNPGEIAMAALLSDIGELLLWAFVPSVPEKALDMIRSREAMRSVEAQEKSCGFLFRNLSLRLCEEWNLPPLIRQLIGSAENPRAVLARLAARAARHAANPDDSGIAAIPDDLREARAALPGAPLQGLIDPLGLPPELEAIIMEELNSDAPAPPDKGRHAETRI